MRTPTQVTRLPALRSVRRLQRQPLAMVRELYGQPPGVFVIALLGRKYLIVSDPDLVRYVLVENEQNYRKNYGAFLGAVGSSSLVTRGEEWRRIRQINQRAFRPELIGGIMAANRPSIAAFADGLHSPDPVDINHAVGALMISLTANGMFARTPNQPAHSVFNDVDCFLPVMDRCALSVTAYGRWLARRSARGFKAALRRWRDLPDQMLAQAPARADASTLHDHLLAAQDGADGIGQERVRDEIRLFLAAGSQTSAAGISFALYLLWLHPHILAAVQQELRDRGVAGVPNAEQLAHLPLLESVMAETLRLYPPVWAISRVAVQTDEIAGIKLKRNDAVIISYFGLHRSPLHWPSPDMFDPARFAAGAAKPRSYVYLPFGAGPRACIGAQLATAQAVSILAAILSRFDIDFLAPRAEPVDRDLRAGISLWPKTPLLARFTGRAGQGPPAAVDGPPAAGA